MAWVPLRPKPPMKIGSGNVSREGVNPLRGSRLRGAADYSDGLARPYHGARDFQADSQVVSPPAQVAEKGLREGRAGAPWDAPGPPQASAAPADGPRHVRYPIGP